MSCDAADRRPRAPVPERRRFLRLTGQVAAACLAAPVLQNLAGCGGEAETAAPGELRVPLAELPDGVRVRRELGTVPVEILREGEAIVARSLLCTHQGCEVQWRPEDREYFCPCHEGRFDADGQVIEGLPPRPLRTYTVRREADVVVIAP